MPEPEAVIPKPKRNFDDYIKLIYGGVAAIATPIIGSVFSTIGTRVATFAGAIISGAIVLTLSRADQRVRTHAKKIHIKGTDWKVSEKTLKRAGVGTLVAIGSACLVIGLTYGVEAATGKTLHGLVTGDKSYGTTFGSSGTTPPKPSATTPAPSQSAAPTNLPSPSPSVTPSTSLVTPTPSQLSPSQTTSSIPSFGPSAQPTTPVEVTPLVVPTNAGNATQ